jgi:hypothetical protein
MNNFALLSTIVQYSHRVSGTHEKAHTGKYLSDTFPIQNGLKEEEV